MNTNCIHYGTFILIIVKQCITLHNSLSLSLTDEKETFTIAFLE